MLNFLYILEGEKIELTEGLSDCEKFVKSLTKYLQCIVPEIELKIFKIRVFIDT